MSIRTKITVTFFSIVATVLTGMTLAIYYFSFTSRQDDFYRRLESRGANIANVLTDIAELNIETIRRMEKTNPASLPNQHIEIYNFRNQNLYTSESRAPLTVSSSLLHTIRLKRKIRIDHDRYSILCFTYQNKDHYYTIVAAATDDFGEEILRSLQTVLFSTFLSSLVLVSILAYLYAGRVLHPISKIITEVSKINEASLAQRLDEGNGHDEISRLAQTFNGMLARLESAFAAQKSFIANASHEIKTPITIMAGEIEVALLQPRPDEYYVRALKSVLTGLRGLNNLSSQLLLLAQTSTDQPEKKFAAIRVDDILWEIKDEMSILYPQTSIQILFDINLRHESMVIEGDEQLIKVAVLNLMDNACKYAEDNSVSINLFEKELDFLSIEFTNKSKGIEAENLSKIFSPFYRGSNNKKIKGFGIGLSLVERIMKLHNGRIEVNSKLNDITRFTITFHVVRARSGRFVKV